MKSIIYNTDLDKDENGKRLEKYDSRNKKLCLSNLLEQLEQLTGFTSSQIKASVDFDETYRRNDRVIVVSNGEYRRNSKVTFLSLTEMKEYPIEKMKDKIDDLTEYIRSKITKENAEKKYKFLEDISKKHLDSDFNVRQRVHSYDETVVVSIIAEPSYRSSYDFLSDFVKSVEIKITIVNDKAEIEHTVYMRTPNFKHTEAETIANKINGVSMFCKTIVLEGLLKDINENINK